MNEQAQEFSAIPSREILIEIFIVALRAKSAEFFCVDIKLCQCNF